MFGKSTTRTGVDINFIQQELLASGWQEVTCGSFMSKSNGQNVKKSYDEQYGLFIRKTDFAKFLRNFANPVSTNGSTMRVSGAVSKLPLHGAKVTSGTATSNLSKAPKMLPLKPSNHLPVVRDFTKYPSLAAARKNQDSLVIAFDSEWVGEPRTMLSWQFACVYDDNIWEFVFLAKDTEDLNIELALGRILDELDFPVTDSRKVTEYRVCTGFKPNGQPIIEVFDNYKAATLRACTGGYAYEGFIGNVPFYDSGNYIPDNPDRFMKYGHGRDFRLFQRGYNFSKNDVMKAPVTLLCHTGKVDVSGLDQTGDFHRDILTRCMDVQGGLMSSLPQVFAPKSVMNIGAINIFPLSFDMRDTMGHAPAGKKSLKSLGETLGIPKVTLPDKPVKYIEHMDLLLHDDPELYFRYASNDSIVTLLYGGTMYGYNKAMHMTLTSATAATMKQYIMKYMGCSTDAEFNLKYRGKKTVSAGKLKDGDKFQNDERLKPATNKAGKVQTHAEGSYFGGYNGCFVYGYYPVLTYDYDIQNAYPTSMSLIPDVDWSDPINTFIYERELDVREWLVGGSTFNPLRLFFGYVRFEFPDDWMYPTIPIRDERDGIPVFPLTSDGIDGVYAAGPEVYLALRLGAKVYCEEGFFLNSLMIEDDENLIESRSMANCTLQFVRDRNLAVLDDPNHDKKNMIAQTLKTMINSGYGKIAQAVQEKHKWDAYTNEMKELDCSCITNAVNASMITSTVRAVLLAAQNELYKQGYTVYSCTTDGFISDAPESVVKSLNLYGFRAPMESSRLFLTDGKSPEIWEIKHVQDDLVNFTTRGNVSRRCKENPIIYNNKEYEGVCAHNSFKTGFEHGSFQDRDYLMKSVLSRTGAVEYDDEEWTTFKELALGKPFRVRTVTRRIHMDADMKRKIDENSLTTEIVHLDGVDYEICNFSTKPFHDMEEFYTWRKKKKGTHCLRTAPQIQYFIQKVMSDPAQVHISDMEWQKLMSCVRGHAKGLWTIPKLDEGTRDEKIAWINSHNHSQKQFTLTDLKNCQRNSRKSKILPEKVVKDLLNEMIKDVQVVAKGSDEDD